MMAHEAAVQHHPSETTLVAYAAGGLEAAAAFVVAAHVDLCPECRTRVSEAETAGGQLLHGFPPSPMHPDALKRTLDRLDQPGPAEADPPDSFGLPSLRQLEAIPLHWLGRGLRHAVLLRAPGGTLRLLEARSDTTLPHHSHRGTEMTCVLKGAFSDELGCFGPGDFAELREEVIHQPRAVGPVACLCLLATMGRLRFQGLLYRLLHVFSSY